MSATIEFYIGILADNFSDTPVSDVEKYAVLVQAQIEKNYPDADVSVHLQRSQQDTWTVDVETMSEWDDIQKELVVLSELAWDELFWRKK